MSFISNLGIVLTLVQYDCQRNVIGYQSALYRDLQATGKLTMHCMEAQNVDQLRIPADKHATLQDRVRPWFSLTNAPQYIQAVYKYYYELAHALRLLNESEQVHIMARTCR